VFDPLVGRFVSGDPNYDCGLRTQGWNRYSYVGNKTLSHIDPTGFSERRRVQWIDAGGMGWFIGGGGTASGVGGIGVGGEFSGGGGAGDSGSGAVSADPVIVATDQSRADCLAQCAQIAHEEALRWAGAIGGATVGWTARSTVVAAAVGALIGFALGDLIPETFSDTGEAAASGLIQALVQRDPSAVLPTGVLNGYSEFAGQTDYPGLFYGIGFYGANTMIAIYRGQAASAAFVGQIPVTAASLAVFFGSYFMIQDFTFSNCTAEFNC
jgi:hypothetical protein